MPYRARWRHRGPSPPDYRLLPPLETVRGAICLQSTICDVPPDGPENRNEHGAEQSPATACRFGGRSHRSCRWLAYALQHPFKRPHGHPQQPADPDRGELTARGGVIGSVAGQAEILLAGLWDRKCKRGIFV